MGAAGLQVGRRPEREELASALHDSAAGRPRAVLVSGEAGIGKTSLVAEATSGPAATGHQVLWGHCMRFAADSSPYLPIGQLLAQWCRGAEPSEKARVLTGAEHLATIAPAVGATTGQADASRIVPLVAAVVDRIAEAGPVVLVVDDVQWADGSSLDLLAYLVAGFGEGQRLCVVATYRDTELGEGHRLHGWLADVARLPSVSTMRLERLGLADVEELVIRLRSEVAVGPLVDRIFDEARGNPYYTELLVHGAADHPGGGQVEGLQQVLLGSWHRLGPEGRELLQLLAIGGRPVAVDVLERLVAARGGDPDSVSPSLAEATASGLTTVATGGEAWFHHPLVAEVVAGTLTTEARTRVHREYVEVLESSADLATASRASHLALHHHGAGDHDDAFVWSLRAADEAAAVRGYAEELEHLHRACGLWEEVGEEARGRAGRRADLWLRASNSEWSAGEHLLAIRLREDAILRQDEGDDPVLAMRLRLPLSEWRIGCGLDARDGVEDRRRVVELAEARCPGSPEHVQALALLVHAEAWVQDWGAVQHAATAVKMARRTGSTEALAWALAMRSETPPWDRALEDATRAFDLAHQVGDPRLTGWAATRLANRLGVVGRDEEVCDVLLTTFRHLVAAGSVHDAMHASPAYGAAYLLELGRWEETREVLRLLLSHRLSAAMGAVTRGVAALMAVRTGDAAAGRSHLTRARELRPRHGAAGDILELLEIEALADLRDSREALTLAARLMPAQVSATPMDADELLVIAARAAGDLGEDPRGRAEAISLLDEIVELRGPDHPGFECTGPEDLVHPARGALFAADRARCHGDTDTADLWRTAVTTCAEAGMVWHEALASYQLGRALLAERGSRADAASALRHAKDVAAGLGAAPIVRDVEEVARQAHVLLDGASPPGSPTSLTPREREILALVAEGRTNGQIGTELFISTKTVSVHVSHILAKLDAASRTEATTVARRRGLLE
ncbi:helix-turn-helix transcriptional regulator [Nocardioides euryhalodurans]|uniref:helix-turn-helix transcriptional regulator n=1 Tax=Nocardioides euryhalodurans TaxID=2518370 RepID=UPI00141EE4B9|nr:helix-turn-helix transcriptional regulator [Nocardioides euryhalodurans]